MQLSVIIVNYNVRPFLENALVSLRKAMANIKGEIFVVDNASDDGSVEIVQSKFPKVHLLANSKNLGFAAANNLALRRSRGKYILLINPDTIVQEDTLRTMIDFFDKNPDVGLAGCKILNPDGTLELASRRSFPTPWVAFTKIIGLSTLFPNTKMFGKYNLTYLHPDETYEVDAVSGSFMFLRREVYENVGELDEQFFMYGEDIDWCYRIQQAGWKIFYVHSTQIIHYKGESVKRSDVDELRLFYDAMHLFVKKHMNSPSLAHIILRMGIVFRSWLAIAAKLLRPLPMVLTDWLFVIISLGLAAYLRFGELLRFPSYGYPALLTVPGAVIVSVMYYLGVYTLHRLAIARAAAAVIIGYIILSALPFFFKEYAFSRIVVIYSGVISFILLPGWRVVAHFLFHSLVPRRSILGRRTLIVGTENAGNEVLRKLRSRVGNGYIVVGFIDISRKRIGEKISGVEILGSIDNIGKVIREHKVTEVIFSTDTLSYKDILSVIGKSRERWVNFRLVPSSLEVIIGKTSIDQLDDIPLVEIDYNINRPMNRFVKRLFDLTAGSVLLCTVYALLRIRQAMGNHNLTEFDKNILMLPKVLSGEYSLVGRPLIVSGNTDLNNTVDIRHLSNIPRNGKEEPYLGKIGLTGLVLVHDREELTREEIEKYNLHYAKNQSLFLDFDILLKFFLLMLKPSAR